MYNNKRGMFLERICMASCYCKHYCNLWFTKIFEMDKWWGWIGKRGGLVVWKIRILKNQQTEGEDYSEFWWMKASGTYCWLIIQKRRFVFIFFSQMLHYIYVKKVLHWTAFWNELSFCQNHKIILILAF